LTTLNDGNFDSVVKRKSSGKTDQAHIHMTIEMFIPDLQTTAFFCHGYIQVVNKRMFVF